MQEYGLPSDEEIDIWMLPRGPHGVERKTITASQRARMLYAIVAVVAEQGYADTTVGDIVRVARLSRKTFYEQFANKESCFIAAYTAVHYGLVRAVIGSQRAGASWDERVRDSVRAYLGFFRDKPEMSMALLVEIHAVGKNAWDCRNWGHDRFARMQRTLYELRRREHPQLPELPNELFWAAIAGIEEMVAMYVRDGRAAELLSLEDKLQFFIRSLYGGNATPADAVSEIHGGAAPS